MRARDNPFSTDRVLRLRYRPQGTTWEQLLSRLEALRYRAAIVGPQGSGKTTLLEDLEPHLRSRGLEPRMLQLHGGQRRFKPAELHAACAGMGPQSVILLDGADHLSWLSWLAFRFRCRQAGGLLVTSHRSGLLPTLVDCTTSLNLLDALVRELIANRVDALPVALDDLFHRHRGNLRDAIRTLYDLFADMPGPSETRPRS